jgi:hypothetical protein
VFIYEVYITIFLVGAIAIYAVRACGESLRPNSGDLCRAGVFLIVCLLYLVGLVASEVLGAPGRGLVKDVTLDAWIVEKTKGVLNLLVNAYLPVLGIYDDTSGVYSWWKLGPAAMLVLSIAGGLMAKLSPLRILLLMSLLILLPVLPTLPLFAASQSPEAWRVSVPILIAFLFAFACVCAVVANAARERRAPRAPLFGSVLALLLVGISVLQFAATIEESRLRVLENEWDEATFAGLESFWEGSGRDNELPISVIRIDVGALDRVRMSPAQKLTVAYGRRGVNSAFGFDFSWPHYLRLSAHGVGMKLFPQGDALRCAGAPSDPCLSPSELEEIARQCISDRSVELLGFKWIHLEDRRISAVCV